MSKKDKEVAEAEPGDMALTYLQTFATPGGLDVLSDLRNVFDFTWYPSTGLSLEMHAGARVVIQHIIDKMKEADKKSAAEVIFKADCL